MWTTIETLARASGCLGWGATSVPPFVANICCCCCSWFLPKLVLSYDLNSVLESDSDCTWFQSSDHETVSRWARATNRRLLISLLSALGLNNRLPFGDNQFAHTNENLWARVSIFITMSPIVQESRFHLMEHVSGPPLGRAGCSHISRLFSLHPILSSPHSSPQNLTPSPPPQLPFLLSLTVGRRGRGGYHWPPPPPSPPSPPTLPPPPSLLGGAWVEKPSSPLTHPNSASETVFKSERVLSVTSHV